MKIACIVCSYPPYPGGIGNSARRLNRLLEKEHEVSVFTPDSLHPWLRRGHGAFLPQLLFRLRSFDCLYLHYPFFGTAEVVWLFKILHPRTKLIIHYHMDVHGLGSFGNLLSLPSRLIRSSLFKQADQIIVSSLDYVKESAIKEWYGKYPEKFQEIPFGLDTERFQPGLAKRYFANGVFARAQEIVNFIDEKFIKRRRVDILFVGGLDRAHYFKGVAILLDALFLSKERNFRLKIVGDGDLRPGYEEKVAKLKLDKQVEFVGRLDDDALLRAFQAADFFVLPSINGNEAFGLVLIEAMACGLPVIASDLPGVRQVFRDGREGYLCQPGEVESLRVCLEKMIADPKKRRQMAAAARQLALEKYDEKKIAARLLEIFR